MTEGFRRRLWAGGLAVLLLGGTAVLATWDVCLSAWALYGVKVPRCPDGKFRQTVGVTTSSALRGVPSHVQVWAQAHAPDPDTGEVMQSMVGRATAALFLVDAQGQETPLPPEKDSPWETGDDDALTTRVKLPPVPDGDYTLRARVITRLGTDSVDAALPLYAPARVHVLTDRPLYEAGNEVRFRAVVLHSKDLSPLDGRPGTWLLKDPEGEVVLEERAPAGPWGVVAGGFPLDKGAPTGTWTVVWQSGGAQATATFRVEPFTLPRFRVDAASPRPFWRAGDAPQVEGQVVYASGAPVTDAEVALEWSHAGEWPAPVEWLSGGLPKSARTDAAGRFEVTLPQVPRDLRGKATLSARVVAKDAAGDRVEGAVALLLAEDALAVSPVTELEGGLVEGFSNRLYLRATTADGRVLPGAELTVRREWDPRDEGVRAVADEDGVAAFQLDPGPPVNVVVPPMPVRRQPPPPPVDVAGLRDLLAREASLEDQLAVERLLPSFFPCARFVLQEEDPLDVKLGLRVGAGGAVADVVAADEALPACLASVLRGRALPAGRERVLELTLTVRDPQLPRLQLETDEAFGHGGPVKVALAAAARDARACLPQVTLGGAPLPAALSWRMDGTGKEVRTAWLPLPNQPGALPASVLACVQERFARLKLPPAARGQEEPAGALGVTRFTAYPVGDSHGQMSQASATVFLGYELRVYAMVDGKPAGSTTLVLRPAELPPTRLRATPVLAQAGGEVRIDLMRGPGFTGALPEKLVLSAGTERLESKVDKASRSARFTLPAGFEGWAEAQWQGAVARVYVAPRAQLSVEVSPDKPVYAPGQLAHLQVRTRVDGKEGPAAVGLFGVDETLGQLAPLPGADALGGLKPAPRVAMPAFGVLDGQALAMGRIRGANAAAAALLRVSGVPEREETEQGVMASAESSFQPDAELTEPFYEVLAELHARVRDWEEKAPEGETLSPEGMAKMWSKSLEACEQRGGRVTDAFGRKLRLSRLPKDLLSLTDPRAVVTRGTRLPEDVENWNAWVAREAP